MFFPEIPTNLTYNTSPTISDISALTTGSWIVFTGQNGLSNGFVLMNLTSIQYIIVDTEPGLVSVPYAVITKIG